MDKIGNKIYRVLQKISLKYQYRSCYRIADEIVRMLGYDNGTAQKHLDNAKDELYAAAREYQNCLRAMRKDNK